MRTDTQRPKEELHSTVFYQLWSPCYLSTLFTLFYHLPWRGVPKNGDYYNAGDMSLIRQIVQAETEEQHLLLLLPVQLWEVRRTHKLLVGKCKVQTLHQIVNLRLLKL